MTECKTKLTCDTKYCLAKTKATKNVFFIVHAILDSQHTTSRLLLVLCLMEGKSAWRPSNPWLFIDIHKPRHLLTYCSSVWDAVLPAEVPPGLVVVGELDGPLAAEIKQQIQQFNEESNTSTIII